MIDLPFDITALAGDDVQVLEDTYVALKAKFKVDLPDNDNHIADKFEQFSNNPNTKIGGVLLISYSTTSYYLVFNKIHYFSINVRGGQNSDYYKYQVWALISSSRDFGNTSIRRETLTDKIVEMLHHVELDFEDDKVFSDKYYVTTNDQEKATKAMNWNFRNALTNINDNDIAIEAMGNDILVGNNKWLDPDQIVSLAESAGKIALVC